MPFTNPPDPIAPRTYLMNDYINRGSSLHSFPEAIRYAVTATPVGIVMYIGSLIYVGNHSPVLRAWGLMSLVNYSTAMAQRELARAMPHPGGPFYWVSRLSPRVHARELSYWTAALSWLAATLTGSSMIMCTALMFFETIKYGAPNFDPNRLLVFMGYRIICDICYCISTSSLLRRISISIFLPAFFIQHAITTVPVLSNESLHGMEISFSLDNKLVLATILVYIIFIFRSLISVKVVTYMSIDASDPIAGVFNAIRHTVTEGTCTALSMILSIFGIVKGVSTQFETGGIIASSHFFARVFHLGGESLIRFHSLVIASCIGSTIAMQTWQSRLSYEISRAGFFPFTVQDCPQPNRSKLYNSCTAQPSYIVSILLGLVYLCSPVAFHSIVACGTILQGFSFSIPIFLAIKYRGRIRKARGKKVRTSPILRSMFYRMIGLLSILWTAVLVAGFIYADLTHVLPNDIHYVMHSLAGMIMLIQLYGWYHANENFQVLDGVLEHRGK